MGEKIKSYKGFNKDMTCRGKQYEEGKTYREKTADACNSGMHACERPVDCFKYYAPGESVFHEVEQSGKISRRDEDSKIASTQMKIGARMNIAGMVKASIEYTKERTTFEHTNPKQASAGDSGAASAGAYGAASAGDRGAASAGDRGAASAGYRGAASAGDRGAASAGDSGAASAGDSGAASAGDSGAAVSRGSAESGEQGLAVVRGDDVKVKGGLGAVLVICEECKDSYDIKHWKAVVVDGKKIKPDVWYCLVDGNFKECDEQ